MRVFTYVFLIVMFFVACGYGSMYMLGGIEAGLPGGGHGKFADYHEGNKVTSFMEGNSFFGDDSRPSWDHAQGDVSSNPFAK